MRWFVVFAMGMLLSCQSEYECDEDRACGFGETCVEGVCQGKSCVTSADCDMQSHCNAGECSAGCAADTDCYAGEACNLDLATCEEAQCEDSHLDCGFNEFCDTSSGECREAGGYYCMACASNDDCGIRGMCNNYGAYGSFCVIECETISDCPSGYSCEPGTRPDATITNYCVASCWLSDDNEAGESAIVSP